MMSRTQISLDPELHRRARRRANELGISFSEYVRRVLAEDLGEPRGAASPTAVFDLGRSDGADVAREKDSMIADALRSGHPGRGTS